MLVGLIIFHILSINRNMRCIEISPAPRPRAGYEINRNMRCIEIFKYYFKSINYTLINRNMRCIEINIDFDLKFLQR